MRELESARSGSLFATLVLSHVWPDGSELDPQLRQRILEHARRNPGKTRTNRERISVAFNARRDPFP
jgi:hypothetical protein